MSSLSSLMFKISNMVSSAECISDFRVFPVAATADAPAHIRVEYTLMTDDDKDTEAAERLFGRIEEAHGLSMFYVGSIGCKYRIAWTI